MYVPEHFRPTDADISELLEHLGAADLVTVTAVGLLATMLPLAFDAPGSRAGTGPAGSLMGHVARNNRQWREPVIGEALVIARGPDAYVTPSWYATKGEHGRVVPTWNYVTAHLHGRLVIHDDPAWVEANVRRLTALHEGRRDAPWSVDDAPRAYVEGQLRAIVGVEVLVERIEAKFKLSQNRSERDVDGVIDGLSALGDVAMADAMRRSQGT
ncbi:MAG: FMN-binding negative transcriptional regulator [Chloroflexi bacterium]|nr:FMN-binding negative transcriptional regulator [Chloroflexota bacterium]